MSDDRTADTGEVQHVRPQRLMLFSGATAGHAKLYRSILSRAHFDGYRAFEWVNEYRQITEPVLGSPTDVTTPTHFFALVRADKAEEFLSQQQELFQAEPFSRNVHGTQTGFKSHTTAPVELGEIKEIGPPAEPGRDGRGTEPGRDGGRADHLGVDDGGREGGAGAARAEAQGEGEGRPARRPSPPIGGDAKFSMREAAKASLRSCALQSCWRE